MKNEQTKQTKAASDKPSKQTRLDAFKDVCHKWLHIENDEYFDVVFGVNFANQLDTKPVWLYLVAPPGGGKTEIVQSFDGHKTIYALTTLTSKTLMSGKIPDSGEKEKKDPSLLPKLDGKILVIKDFTSILSLRNDEVREIFGQLRDAYDGTSRAVYGTGKDTMYKSKFGIIAAVTNVIDKNRTSHSILGERFLTYRLPKLSEAEIEKRTDMAAENKSVKTQEEQIKKAAHAVLNMEREPASISRKLKKELGKIAMFVAVARAGIERDRQTKQIVVLPDPEIPTRLVKQFVSLAQGIAMAREQEEVTEDEAKLVGKVALGSVPPMRLEILRCLMKVYPKSMTADGIAGKLKLKVNYCGKSATERRLDDLYVCGIVKKTKADRDTTTPWDWSIKKKYGELLRELGL